MFTTKSLSLNLLSRLYRQERNPEQRIIIFQQILIRNPDRAYKINSKLAIMFGGY